MTTLHLIQSSPYQSSALSRCLTQLENQDGILLLENGVYGACNAYSLSTQIHPLSSPCFALRADLTARGITDTDPMITMIDYQAFVDLIAQFDNSLTWS
ncbi:tRNA 2-thiouridine synthesizing protein B [Piscirickettsia salmonis]|uniref:Sulfur relay protein DsrH n=1 Tax=Piscirickettsia salmonis TaxID=1238 RepID=A0A1L6TDF4_PISSA|nr:sulfurtransferase complex subunit TusB [Piscirickettsia salmonis]ALB23455.1 sulfur relay protein DsrH [Piscirickettsia salmonis]ALT18589.1 sulfur relay protein DsrH [Piscirickettsia salmonis LF-89 = ATCC VR-1361]ALY03333.1 sulfur relay protein DsrH [Piscirickettsia salmonis]AMA42899.1 sulfur relay protein DsrH [Piscirickettsia salmonis]AOS35367.1 sulfur relay protein DsrH [Piscirickettsia salmonis]